MDDFLTEKQIARINRLRAERAAKKIMGSAEPTTRFGEPIKRPTTESLIEAAMEGGAKADAVFESLFASNRARADARYREKVEKLRKLGNSEALKKWVELFVKNLDEKNLDIYDMAEELRGFNGFLLLPYSSTRLKAKDIPGYEFDRFIKKYRENPDSVSFEDFPIDLAIDIVEDDYWRKANIRYYELQEKYRETLPKKKNGAPTAKSEQLLSNSIQRLMEQAKNEIYPEGMRR
jgi:hypothetical protein